MLGARVEVIVPWQPGCDYRQRALGWVLARYADEHPGWRVTVAETTGAWCKARAVIPAVTASNADIVVIADADVWTPDLPFAVEAVANGAGWAMPHRLVLRLTEPSTTRLLAGDETIAEYDQRPYSGVEGGGITVLRRTTFLGVPLDARFVGWGQEDVAWAAALNTLAGPVARGRGDLLHLWHPPQPRATRKIGSLEGRALWRRYLLARRDPDVMRELIEEARHELANADQSAVPDRPAVRVR